jgi:hypothetical protein
MHLHTKVLTKSSYVGEQLHFDQTHIKAENRTAVRQQK